MLNIGRQLAEMIENWFDDSYEYKIWLFENKAKDNVDSRRQFSEIYYQNLVSTLREIVLNNYNLD